MLQAIGLTSTPRRDASARRGRPDLRSPARPRHRAARRPGLRQDHRPPADARTRSAAGASPTSGAARCTASATPPARSACCSGTCRGTPRAPPAVSSACSVPQPGFPPSRADELLEVVGLAGLGDQRLGTLSAGMDRRLGLASALLGDPHTLVLDEPAEGLSPRERSWLHGLLRAHAAQGGTVLHTTGDPKEAARAADRVVTIDEGRLVADQDVADFSRTRLRPRVAVRTPHAARLAAVLSREARAAQRSVEVVAEERQPAVGVRQQLRGGRGHGVPARRPRPPTRRRDRGRRPGAAPVRGAADVPVRTVLPGPASAVAISKLPPADPRTPGPWPAPAPAVRTAPSLRRQDNRPDHGGRSGRLGGRLACCWPAPARHRCRDLLVAWPDLLPLPPAAFAAGLLGRSPSATSSATRRSPPAGGPSRAVSVSCWPSWSSPRASRCCSPLLSVLADAEALRLVYGGDLVAVPPNAPRSRRVGPGLSVGCAWAGLLAAGVFRLTGRRRRGRAGGSGPCRSAGAEASRGAVRPFDRRTAGPAA